MDLIARVCVCVGDDEARKLWQATSDDIIYSPPSVRASN